MPEKSVALETSKPVMSTFCRLDAPAKNPDRLASFGIASQPLISTYTKLPAPPLVTLVTAGTFHPVMFRV